MSKCLVNVLTLFSLSASNLTQYPIVHVNKTQVSDNQVWAENVRHDFHHL